MGSTIEVNPGGGGGSPGPVGPQGPTGPAGPGVPVGGTTGQVLAKIDNTNYNTQWVAGGASTWGSITGTLSAQTDLQTALDAKADKAGTANRFAAYNSLNELAPYNPLSINLDNGVDLFQTVAPAATGNYIKHNNQFFQVNPSVNSNEHWYADWREPRINDTGFNMGNPATGNGGLNGMGMAMTADYNFGYMRNFDFSIQVGNGTDVVVGYSVAAINQYINVANNVSLEIARGFPVTISGQTGSTIENVVGYNLNLNIANCTNSVFGWQLGGNIAFTGPSTYFIGMDINGSVTGVVDATGLNINMGSVTASNSKRAIYAIGDCLFDGDVQVTGSFNFTGDLSIGSIQSFKSIPVVNGGGTPTTNNGIVTQLTGTGTVSNCDMIGLATPSLINLGSTFVGTSGVFGLGLASLALPNIITMNAGCSLDNLTSSAYVNLFDASNTGGTIDRVVGCRALNISQGGTQTITRAYNFFADYFAGDVAVDSWGFYDSGAKYNWMANCLKIGTGDTVANSSIGLEVTGKAIRFANMNTAARNALTAVAGMSIYNTDTLAVERYNGSAWGVAGVPAGGDAGFVLSKLTGTDYDTHWGGTVKILSIIDGADLTSIEVEDRWLRRTDGQVVINWQDGQIFGINGNVSIDWFNGYTRDAADAISVNWLDRILVDAAEVTSLNWTNKTLFDNGGNLSANWDLKINYDGNGDASLDWKNRILRESGDNAVSIDWENRYLGDSNEVSSLDWGNRHLQSGGLNRISWAGGLGFYGVSPVAQPASSGSVTAGVVYTAAEQTMLNNVYQAMRALGLMA